MQEVIQMSQETYDSIKAKMKADEKAKRLAKRNLDTKWHGDMNINSEAKKIWKLLTPYHGGKPMPPIEVTFDDQRGRNGWAYISQPWRGVVVKKTDDIVTFYNILVHELTHMAVGVRAVHGQWNKKHQAHDREFYMAMRDVYQKRWKIAMSFSKVTKWGYNVDDLIRTQMREQDVIKFKPRKREAA